ncbi:MAG: phosphohydrolase, partial [Oscillospiraceae bacterium]|nr:phosphohydrolase [Oscillospiraceae bacterium]
MVFPKSIADIFSLLDKSLVKAYVVGGAVRDIVMGKEPTDYDMAAECLPEDLLRIFADCRCFDHSIRFGTLNIVTDDGIVEITCCRMENGYSDLRRPDSVEFCKDIKKDLCRRDFTVNAMAMDAQGNIIDIFDGIGDIERRIIRTVGNADARFSEDALRIMRALRFASTLGFEIEEDTKRAIHKNVHLLKNISSERIYEELTKLIMGDRAAEVLLEYSDVICEIIPELSLCVGFEQNNPHHI